VAAQASPLCQGADAVCFVRGRGEADDDDPTWSRAPPAAAVAVYADPEAVQGYCRLDEPLPRVLFP
jgi:hypothetical protein